MKTGWQTLLLLVVGFGATAGLYWFAVADVQPIVDTGSGRLFVPDITAEELLITQETGSGSLRQEVQDEQRALELLFDHNNKSLRLASYMYSISEDTELRLLANSMSRRHRLDLLQIRQWLLEWYNTEVPLPGEVPLPVAVEQMPLHDAYAAFIDYELKHHTWNAALVRLAQTKPLREEMKDFTRYLLRANRLEEDLLKTLQNRF